MRLIFDVLRDGLAAINTAADEIGETTTLGRLDAYRRSADSAAARLAAADGVFNRIVDKLTAGIVAGLSGRGSTKTAADRAAAAAEVRSVRATLVDDINTTFNGSALFAGSHVTTPAYVLSGGTWTYQGNAAAVQLEVDKGRLVSVSFDGQAIAQGGDAVDMFTAMDALAASIEGGDDAGIGAGIDALERAFDRVSRAHGRLGADERGVDAAAARVAAMRLAAETRRSTLDDTNLAEAITRMNEADNAYRAALGAVSSAERLSLLDYLK